MDILTPDKPLVSAAPVVQILRTLAVGAYDVELEIVDSAGIHATATLSFQIVDRVIVRPPFNVDPVVTPVVHPGPPTPPIRRPIINKPKPPEPIE